MNLPLFQPFPNEWILFFLILFGMVLLIGLMEWVRNQFCLSPDTSRKFIHVIVGLLISFSPLYYSTPAPLIALSILFIGINIRLISSTQFSSMAGLERKSFGTVYFPIAFLILILFWWEKPIGIMLSLFVMTLSDTLASIIGNRFKNVRNYQIWSDKKSVEGSIAMFLSTALIIYIGTDFFSWFFKAAFFLPITVLVGVSLFTAAMATLAEATSKQGSDNLSVPLITFLSYDLFLVNYTHGHLGQFLLWVLFSLTIFSFAFKWKSLTASGFIGGFALGVFVFGSGGLKWILPLVIFFLTASLLSKISRSSDSGFQKGSNRDILQVLANGGIGALFSLANFYSPHPVYFLVYLGAIAAAMADTWATEIGAFSANPPRNILTFKRVKKGTSGGVTLLGSFGGLAGAFLLAGIGAFYGLSLQHVLFITFAGFLGNVADSVLGASVQSLFVCNHCEKLTERRVHCGKSAIHQKGWKCVDNDMVNLLNTLAGAILVYVGFIIAG